MKRYWVVRHGLLLNSTACKDQKEAEKFARESEKSRRQKSGAKRSKAISEYAIVEETITYQHIGNLEICPEMGPRFEATPSSPIRAYLAKAVKLILPRHLACDSVPREMKEKLEELLSARFGRTKGRAKAGDLF